MAFHLKRTDDPNLYVANIRRRRFVVQRHFPDDPNGYPVGWSIREMLGKDKNQEQIWAQITDGVKTLREVRSILDAQRS